MILLICIFAIAFCVAWGVICVINMFLDLERDTDVPAEPPPKPFSVSEYLDRMERAHKSIIEKRENEEPYTLILWWGLDGLRLNKDGTTEWINRRPRTVFRATASRYPMYDVAKTICGERILYPVNDEIDTSTLGDTRLTQQINCSIAAQTERLREQMQELEAQMWQSRIMQVAIEDKLQTPPLKDRCMTQRNDYFIAKETADLVAKMQAIGFKPMDVCDTGRDLDGKFMR